MMPSSRHLKLDSRSSNPKQTVAQPMNVCGVPQIPAFGQYYVYASGPKLASVDRKNKKSRGISRGPQGHHNIMWDPRIYRGTTYTTYKMAEEKRCKKHELEIAANQHKKTRASASAPTLNETRLGGISRPKTPPHHTSDKIGLEDMGIQTEKFLEEITDEVKEREMCTQTDHIFDVNSDPLFCPLKLGLDATTQIEPWELFTFDEEANPIIISLVGKIIEQALFETMEEIELESLKEQQYVHEEKHREQLMRMQRLQEREQKVTEERSRLIKERQIEFNDEKVTENQVAATLFSVAYLRGIANNVLNDLRRDGHMVDTNGLEDSFVPWLHNRSIWQFCKTASANTLLDDIIKHVVDDREGDVADGIWREISAQNQLYQSGNSYLSGELGEYEDE